MVSQDEEWASLSATSIGTEENSLGVLKAQNGALICTRGSVNKVKGDLTSTKSPESVIVQERKWRLGSDRSKGKHRYVSSLKVWYESTVLQ